MLIPKLFILVLLCCLNYFAFSNDTLLLGLIKKEVAQLRKTESIDLNSQEVNKALTILAQGKEKYKEGDVNSALWLFHKSATSVSSPELQSLIYQKIGFVHYTMSNYMLAKKNYFKSFQLDSNLSHEWVIETYKELAKTYSNLGNIDSTKLWLQKAEEAYSEIDDPFKRARFYSIAGTIFIKLSQPEKALYYNMLAIKLFSLPENYNVEEIFFLYLQCARIDKEFMYKKDTWFYLEELRKIAPEINHIGYLGSYNTLLGMYFFENSKPDSALFYYEKAKSYYESENYIEAVVTVNVNIADVYLESQQNEASLVIYKESLDFFRNKKLEQYVPELLWSIGKNYNQLKNYKRAIDYFNEFWNHPNKDQKKRLREKVLEEWVFALKNTNNFKEALSKREQLDQLRRNTEISSKTKKQQEKAYLSFIVKQKDIIVKQRDELTESINSKKKENKWLLIALFIVFSTTLVALVIGYRKRKKISEENDVLIQQLNHYKGVLKKESIKNETLIKTISPKIKEQPLLSDQLIHLVTKNDWPNFMTSFELSFPGLLSKISEQSSRINQNDLKVCALIKLQLKNKEIADKLNITEDAVKKAKQRIRKKLNLSTNQEVISFIQKG